MSKRHKIKRELGEIVELESELKEKDIIICALQSLLRSLETTPFCWCQVQSAAMRKLSDALRKPIHCKKCLEIRKYFGK
jgi:RNase P protein component